MHVFDVALRYFFLTLFYHLNHVSLNKERIFFRKSQYILRFMKKRREKTCTRRNTQQRSYRKKKKIGRNIKVLFFLAIFSLLHFLASSPLKACNISKFFPEIARYKTFDIFCRKIQLRRYDSQLNPRQNIVVAKRITIYIKANLYFSIELQEYRKDYI